MLSFMLLVNIINDIILYVFLDSILEIFLKVVLWVILYVVFEAAPDDILVVVHYIDFDDIISLKLLL